MLANPKLGTLPIVADAIAVRLSDLVLGFWAETGTGHEGKGPVAQVIEGRQAQAAATGHRP